MDIGIEIGIDVGIDVGIDICIDSDFGTIPQFSASSIPNNQT